MPKDFLALLLRQSVVWLEELLRGRGNGFRERLVFGRTRLDATDIMVECRQEMPCLACGRQQSGGQQERQQSDDMSGGLVVHGEVPDASWH